jgi:hypothetical protein
VADTRVQLEVEDWVRKEWMPTQFGQRFRRERVPLISGGVFDFDAVSDDDKIVAAISTSGATTASGKLAVGKLLKIRSDMLFLVLARAERKLIVLTEEDMVELCLKEREGGRVPTEIEFMHAEIPSSLRAKLTKARASASDEVQPRTNR